MGILEKIDSFLVEAGKYAPEEEKYLTKAEIAKQPYAMKVTMIKKRKKEGKKVNEATVEFYKNAQDNKPTDKLKVDNVPALLRAVGQGAKKISLESEGNRAALNKALKSGKTIYVSFNPFHQDIAGINQILWHTDKKKFVKTYGDLAMEV